MTIRRDDGGPLEGWGRTVLALAIVLLVILGLRVVLKRFARPHAGARAGVVEVLARTSVQPRQHLLLVRLGRRLLLLGSSPSGLSTLSVVSDPEEVAELSDAAMGEDLKRLAARRGGASRESKPAAGTSKEGGPG